MSARLKFDKSELLDIVKVAAYSGASAFFAYLIMATGDLEVPAQYAVFVPVVNSVLVAAKNFFQNKVN